MKKTLSLLAALVSGAAMAGIIPLHFSSKGPDCYADGTVVADGEIYALVWSRTNDTGSVVSPFVLDAKGEPVDPANHTVLARAAIAKNGGCPGNSYLLSDEEAALASQGEFAVYLLDTRAKASEGGETSVAFASGAGDGTLCCSGYERVPAKLEFRAITTARGKSGDVGAVTGEGAAETALPANARQPRIVDFRVNGDTAVVEVGDTEKYITYALEAYNEIGGEKVNLANCVQGAGDGTIGLTADASKYRFFKVARSESKNQKGDVAK